MSARLRAWQRLSWSKAGCPDTAMEKAIQPTEKTKRYQQAHFSGMALLASWEELSPICQGHISKESAREAVIRREK